MQQGGGAMLLEFEHDFRHPHPDTGSKVETAIRANSNFRVSILLLRQVRNRGGAYERNIGSVRGSHPRQVPGESRINGATCPLNVQL